MVAELRALETEQKQIDGRAAIVEKELRGLMESGRERILAASMTQRLKEFVEEESLD